MPAAAEMLRVPAYSILIGHTRAERIRDVQISPERYVQVGPMAALTPDVGPHLLWASNLMLHVS